MRYAKIGGLLVGAALFWALIIVGLRAYVRYSCVAPWLHKCHPYMSADELFETLPERFHKRNEKAQWESKAQYAVPYVGFFPSNSEDLNWKYSYYVESIDKTYLFVDSCTFYFNDKRQLVCIHYSAPHARAFYLRNRAWEKFVLVFSEKEDTKEDGLKKHINVQDLRTGESHLYRMARVPEGV